MTVLEMIKDRLLQDKLEGLVNSKFGCGCSVHNLAYCGAIENDCRGAYRMECKKCLCDCYVTQKAMESGDYDRSCPDCGEGK